MGVEPQTREGGSDWLTSGSHEGNRHFLSTATRDGCQMGFYGWRRRCLFVVVTILLLLALLNLALTLWILKVMEFTSSGLGPLRVVSGGLQLRGEALVLDSLVASKIRSRKGQGIQIESNRNISLNARSPNGKLSGQLFLGDSSMEVVASSMRIGDVHGRPLFSVDKKEMLVGADTLVVTGEGGVIFGGSLQTPKVKADSGHELRLESPTRSLDIFGTFGVNLISDAGDISVMALDDIKLQSETGSVRLEAPNIYFPALETVHVADLGGSVKGQVTYGPLPADKSAFKIYQVCICQKGRIFLAPPEGECVADNDVCR